MVTTPPVDGQPADFPAPRVIHAGTTNGITLDALNQGGANVGQFLRASRGDSSLTGAQPPSPSAGRGAFELDNSSGDYGQVGLLPGDRFQIRRTDPDTTDVHDLFYGFAELPTDMLRIPAEPQKRKVSVQLNGVMSWLIGRKFSSTGLFENITTGDAIGWVLDAVGWPESMRDLDTGETTLLWWWADDDDAFQMILKILGSEGATAQFYERGDGTLVFRGRNWRVDETYANAVQQTFRTIGTAPLLRDFSRERAAARVFNSAAITTNARAGSGDVEVIWEAGREINMGPGEVIKIVVRASNGEPFQAAVQPVLNTDYTVSGGTLDSATLNQFGGGAVTLTLVSTSGVLVTGLQMRAESIRQTNFFDIESDVDAAASITQYGPRAWDGAYWPEITWQDAKAVANAIVTHNKDGRPRAQILVHAEDDAATLTACLDLDIGHRVRVIEGNHGLDEEYWVEHIDYEIGAPLEQFNRYTLERAVAFEILPPVVAPNPFIINVDGHRAPHFTGTFWPTSLMGAHFLIRNGDVIANRTTDGGTTWTETSVWAGSSTNVAYWFDQQTPGFTGSIVYIVIADSGGSGTLNFTTFDLSDASVGTPVVIVADTVGTSILQAPVAITRCVSGRLEVEMLGNSDEGARHSDDLGATWDGPHATVNVSESFNPEPNGNDILSFPGTTADTNDSMYLYHSAVHSTLKIRMHDHSADSFTSTTLSSDINVPAFQALERRAQFDGQVRLSDGHVIVAALTRATTAGNDATNDCLVWDVNPNSIASPSVTAKTNAFTNVAKYVSVSVFIDQRTDAIHLVFADSVNNICDYTVSLDGGATWSTPAPCSAPFDLDPTPNVSNGYAGAMSATDGRFQPVIYNNTDAAVNASNLAVNMVP